MLNFTHKRIECPILLDWGSPVLRSYMQVLMVELFVREVLPTYIIIVYDMVLFHQFLVFILSLSLLLYLCLSLFFSLSFTLSLVSHSLSLSPSLSFSFSLFCMHSSLSPLIIYVSTLEVNHILHV